jgi:tRNA A-37 threonylcarbamoyl transferase component Bud32
VGRATARAERSVADGLASLLAIDVAAWPQHGLELVKQRTVRSVFRGTFDGVPVHVKVFRADTLADHVRDWVRQARGSAEARHLDAARNLGLPVVEPLAHGFALEAGRRRSFVATRTASGAPFDFATATPAALAATGRLLRRVHDLGVKLLDLHPGNLLIAADDTPILLDLTSMAHGGEPGLRERARALAFFCHELDGGALDPQATALLAGYLAAGPMAGSLPDELVLATRRWRAAALPAFGRRAGRPCKQTATTPRRRGMPRWFWHLVDDTPERRAACEQFAAAPPAASKAGRRGAVWLVGDLAVKQREAAKARRLFQAAYWLLFAGVPAPAPVALRLHGGLGLVFARRIGSMTLADELQRGTLGAMALAATARQLGDSVGRLHAHGLGNRDLKLDNLVRDPASGLVAMVDLDGVRRRSARETRGRGADLGRLLAAFRGAGGPGGTATVRTFLRGYLRAHRALLQDTPLRRLLQVADRRAGEWASAHR